MQAHQMSPNERLKLDADLLTEISRRREREGDPGIFSSVEQQILKRAWPSELTPEEAAELDRINAEIAASEQALRDGSVPAEDAALWHADWVAEKILFEAELKRSFPPAPERLTRMEPHTDSGVYRGLIVGETARHIVQQLPSHALVAHRKENLERSPRTGETVAVRYSNGQATVRDAQSRSRAKDLGSRR